MATDPLATRLRRAPRLRAALASGALLLAGCHTPPPAVRTAGVAAPSACTFTNPVGRGADPWVVRHDGWYYLVESRGGGLWISRSGTLTGIKAEPERAVRVWSAPESGWNRSNVWAPELHFLDGRWYIYYAAGAAGPPFLSQRSGVLQSAGADAMGPYTDRGMLHTGDGPVGSAPARWAIDLTPVRIGGRLYAIWSGWESDATTDRTPQHLYIAPMSNPWTIAGPRVLLSSPTEPWEMGTELSLNEGPQVLWHGRDLFVVYSTRESWLPAYRLGLLRLRPGADPLDPSSWTKSGPVFTGTDQVFGVGHASFTTSPDGREEWIVYHSKADARPGWDRVIRMQPFGWKKDGTPDFGTPVPPDQPLAVPSGECG